MRSDVLPLIPDKTKSLLSLGCGAALTEGKFRQTHDCKVTGIEIVPSEAESAQTRIDRCLTGSVERTFPFLKNDTFDCILALDVLEHLRDPWAVLRQYVSLLSDDGVVIASIPNINHHSIRARLALDVFPYEPAGILDDTHVRFFTLTEIYKLFSSAGLKIIKTNSFKTRADSLQYLIVAKHVYKKIDRPEVTIVIPTLGNLHYTKQCVNSWRLNTHVPSVILVIDNGSTDGTREWLLDQPDILHILNTSNLGFGMAVNQGLFCVSSPYVVIANNDIIFTPDWLTHLIAHASRDDNVGLVGPMTNFVSGPQKLDIANFGPSFDLDGFANSYYDRNKKCFQEFARLVFFCTLIKKTVLDKIGFLDERFLLGNFEDDDFCRRAHIAGFKAIIAQDTFIYHHGHTTFKSQRINLGELLKKNYAVYLNKWGDNSKRRD